MDKSTNKFWSFKSSAYNFLNALYQWGFAYKSTDHERELLNKQILVAKQNKVNSEDIKSPPQLLLDVSVITRIDAGTGIQRVVREISRNLAVHALNNYSFELRVIYATHGDSFRCLQGLKPSFNDPYVEVKEGDIFFGLDLSHLLLSKVDVLYGWKMSGVSFHFVLYDLLPLNHPEWFNRRAVKNFKRWLKIVGTYSDSIYCISDVVRNDVKYWLDSNLSVDNQPELKLLKLGANFKNYSDIKKGSINFKQEVALILRLPFYLLMVGTLEPRKGHRELLLAFERLWEWGYEIPLVLVGKRGWRTTKLQKQIKSHTQIDNKLFWIECVNDSDLDLLYQNCGGVIVPSKGEGYGLPIIEGLQYQKKILARDLSVFREVAQDKACYFIDDNPDALALSIVSWIKVKQTLPITGLITWEQAAIGLIDSLGLEHPPKN